MLFYWFFRKSYEVSEEKDLAERLADSYNEQIDQARMTVRYTKYAHALLGGVKLLALYGLLSNATEEFNDFSKDYMGLMTVFHWKSALVYTTAFAGAAVAQVFPFVKRYKTRRQISQLEKKLDELTAPAVIEMDGRLEEAAD